jgi:hypothetical protein
MKKEIMAKNEYIGFRTSKKIKQIIQELADKEYRTLSQQCEMAVIEWLKEHGHFGEKSDK